MNQVSFSKEAIEEMYELPKDFPTDQVCDNLIRTIRTLGDYAINDEWQHWRFEFMLHALKAFASSTHFQNLSPDARIDIIGCWDNLRYVLEQLADLFSSDLNENCAAVCYYLGKKLLPENMQTESNL